MRAGFLAVIAVLVCPAALAFSVPHGAPSGESIVSVAPDVGRADLEARGLAVLEAFPVARAFLVAGSPAAVKPLLAGLDAVAYPVEPIELHLAESRAAVRAEDLPLAAARPGAGVAVAVVDSGADESHPGLSDRVVAHVRVSERGAEVARGDSSGHGTHVAGILAGTGASSPAHRGVAPGADLVVVDIRDAFTTTNAIRAFQWISDHAPEHGVRVVSNSWGREKADARHDANDPLTRAVDALVDQGLVVVFSAGNRGPGASTLTQEAMNPRVVTVGATDDRGSVESYSSRGPALSRDGSALAVEKPDLVAPGSRVVSTRAGGGYVSMNGTSMAAPHVSAAAAILLSEFPVLSPEAIREILVGTADRGLLDVGAALDAAARAHRVVVERRVPIAVTGEVLAVAGRGLGGASSGAFDVPRGATELALAVAWDGLAPDGAEARLLRSGVTVASGASATPPIRLAVSDPDPGSWSVEVVPRGAAERASWSANGAVVVTEYENGTAGSSVEKSSRGSAFDLPARPGGAAGRVLAITAAFALSVSIVGVRKRL